LEEAVVEPLDIILKRSLSRVLLLWQLGMVDTVDLASNLELLARVVLIFLVLAVLVVLEIRLAALVETVLL
jgi:hypothetical protein